MSGRECKPDAKHERASAKQRSEGAAINGRLRPGGYCVTLAYPIPLLPSGPGGFFELQLRSPPKPFGSGCPLKRREWDSNPRWSFPHTRFPSVLLKPARTSLRDVHLLQINLSN